MTRAFTDEERRQVRAALLSAARAEFSRAGYRGASIAAIAREARIGKGTVYLFFSSKAEIFARVLEEIEREMRVELLDELDRSFDGPRERLELFFRVFLTRMADHPLLWIVVDPAEAAAFFRDLGPDARRFDEADAEFYQELVPAWQNAGWLGDVQPEVFAGATRALYAVSLHRDLIGEAYTDVVDLLVEALAHKLLTRP